MSKLELAAKKALESLLDYHKYDEDKISVAIDVLQAALAEQAECPHGVDDGACKECYMEQACPNGCDTSNGRCVDCPDPVAEQAEQEPVAIIEKEAGFETEVYATGHADSLPDGVFKLYAAPVQQAEQEPVAWVDEDGFPWKYNLDGKDWVPLYAAPVRTKDLTDIEYLQDAVTKALKKAFHLGQTHFQQADSESYAANKRADITLELYRKLEDDTRSVIAADREKNKC